MGDIPAGLTARVLGRGRDYTDVPPLRSVYACLFTSVLFVKMEITREGSPAAEVAQ